jgi:catechol 2,3-dioxygenase-like lactoylglutathione lyase family enzyme
MAEQPLDHFGRLVCGIPSVVSDRTRRLPTQIESRTQEATLRIAALRAGPHAGGIAEARPAGLHSRRCHDRFHERYGTTIADHTRAFRPGLNMPTTRGILELSLYCDDAADTAAFYRRLLRCDVLVESERLTALDAGGATVLLVFQRGQTADAVDTPGGMVPGHDGSGPSHLAFAVDTDQLDAWYGRLADLDIDIESTVAWPRGGRSLYFRDPDGRSVELATPGLWATY